MKYAVIELGGKQHKITEGQELLVNHLKEEKVEPKVLLVVSDKITKIGAPYVKGSKVVLKKIGEERGKKIVVNKFKAKSKYRKRIGHRSEFTRLSVGKITP